GDEVFWGYKHYRWLENAARLAQLPSPMRRLTGFAAGRWGGFRGQGKRVGAGLLMGAGSVDRVFLSMRGFFAPDQVARLVDITHGELEEIVEEQFGFAEVRGGEPGRILNYLEMKRYLHDQLLRDTDVFGMAHSIEARVPYLDHVVV